MGADVSIRDMGDVVVASLSGDVDMMSARGLTDDVLASVTNDALGLVMDLERLRYIDSAGISCVFAIIRKLEARGKRLTLAVPSDSPVRSLLTVTHVQDAAPVEVSVEAAVKTIRSSARDPLG